MSADNASIRFSRSPFFLAVCAIVVFWALFFGVAYKLQVDHRQNVEAVLSGKIGVVSGHVSGVFRTTQTALAAVTAWIEQNPDRDPHTDPRFADLIDNRKSVV